MVSYKELSAANQSVDCSDQRALVAGGTQGIGAGVALRFALSGASVWIIGRNESKANEVLAKLEQASAEAVRRKTGSPPASTELGKHAFFQADLSLAQEVKRVADEVSEKAGKGGIDYLIETQGGPPNGKIAATKEGIESQFAVQCVSRFGLANILTSNGIVKRGVLMVAAPAQGGKKLVDLDDIDFQKTFNAGKWWGGPFGMLKKGTRDSQILDAAAQTLAERHPNLTISHLFPGFILTDALSNTGQPGPLVWASKIFGPLVANKPGPGGYAEVPFHLLTHPDGQRYLETGKANLLGPWLKKYTISPAAATAENRQKIWSKLESYFK